MKLGLRTYIVVVYYHGCIRPVTFVPKLLSVAVMEGSQLDAADTIHVSGRIGQFSTWEQGCHQWGNCCLGDN